MPLDFKVHFIIISLRRRGKLFCVAFPPTPFVLKLLPKNTDNYIFLLFPCNLRLQNSMTDTISDTWIYIHEKKWIEQRYSVYALILQHFLL